MKAKDLLDMMGEIDAGFIEDAAGSAEGNSLMKRIARYGAIAAAIGVVSFSAYAIYGVVRDGILANQPVTPGYSSAADSGEAAATLLPREPQSETETTYPTLPTDLYVIETLESTTTTTTEKVLPFPADAERPDASLEQEIGDRFLVNDLSRSGIIAMTVLKADAYDSLEAAGLTEDDLIKSYREGYSITQCHASSGHGNNKEECSFAYLYKSMYFHDFNYEEVKTDPENYRFILLKLKVENLNAVSGLPDFWNQCRFSTDPEKQSVEDGFDPFTDDYIVDPEFARDSDFNITGMSFCFHTDIERNYGAMPRSPLAYFSLSGQEYSDAFRSEWFRLEPGTAITFEVGAFLPKIYTEAFKEEFVPDNWEPDIRIGEDMLQRYYFGAGSISRPHVDLHFDEPES